MDSQSAENPANSTNNAYSNHFQAHIQALLDNAFDALPQRARAIDIGSGAYTVRLAQKFTDVIGLELSEKNVSTPVYAENTAVRPVDFTTLDAATLPRANGVTAILILEALPNPLDALAKVATMLDSGGRGLIVIPRIGSLHLWLYRRYEEKQPQPQFWNGISADKLITQLPNHQLALIEQGSFHNMPPFLLGGLQHLPLVKRLRSLLYHIFERLPIGGSYSYVIVEKREATA